MSNHRFVATTTRGAEPGLAGELVDEAPKFYSQRERFEASMGLSKASPCSSWTKR